MDTIRSCCTQLECFEYNRMLLHAYCGLSVHAARILFHSVISKRYYFIYTHCCLQHPLIYNHVRYCNIYSIRWLAYFQFKFYIRESEGGGGGEGHSLVFFYQGGSPFYDFLQWGGALTFLESF